MKRPRLLSILSLLAGIVFLVAPLAAQDDIFGGGTRQSALSGLTSRMSMRGRVTDEQTGQPLFQAMVTVTVFSGGLARQAATDSMGSFQFVNLGRGRYYVSVTLQGYQEGREEVDLSVASNYFVNIMLRRKATDAGGTLIEPLSVEEQLVPKPARKEYEKGVEEYEKGNFGAAITRLEAALQLYPQYASACHVLGLVRLRRVELAAAREQFERAIAINSNFAAPRIFLGGIYNSEQRYREAEAQLLQALALQPRAFLGHYELSRSYWALGDVARSGEHADRAHELRPTVPNVHLLRANVFAARQDHKGALAEFDHFLELEADGPRAEHVRVQRAALKQQLTAARKN